MVTPLLWSFEWWGWTAFSMQFNSEIPLNQLHWRQGLFVGKGLHSTRPSTLHHPILKHYNRMYHKSRTYIRIWSPRFAASWLWILVGEGSRHIWSVTSGEGLALRVGNMRRLWRFVAVWHTWDLFLRCCGPAMFLWLWNKHIFPKLAQNWSDQEESDCLIKTKHCDGLKRCWRNVISAQCSECQSEEIQPSAGKRRE